MTLLEAIENRHSVRKYIDKPIPKELIDSLKAPTAVNQQKFHFEYTAPNKVKATKKFSLMGYTETDLGIAKLHFEIGAGKGNFEFVG